MPKEHEHSAYRFHTDLFLSGLERIILASNTLSISFIQVYQFQNYCRFHEKHRPHTTQTSILN